MSASHYQTLQVEATANLQDVRAAYRRLAMRYHPDKNGGDDTQFKVIQSAYDVLSDPSKRRTYDFHLECERLCAPPRRSTSPPPYSASAPPRPSPMTAEEVMAKMMEDLRINRQQQFEELRRRAQGGAEPDSAAERARKADEEAARKGAELRRRVAERAAEQKRQQDILNSFYKMNSEPQSAPPPTARAANTRARAIDNPLWHKAYPTPTCCGLTKKNAPCKVKIGLFVLDGTASCKMHVWDKMKGLVSEWAKAAPSRSSRSAIFEATLPADGERHGWEAAEAPGEALYLRVRCPAGDLKAGYKVRVGQKEVGTCVAIQQVPTKTSHKSEQVNVQVLAAGEIGVLKVQCIEVDAHTGRWKCPLGIGALASDDVITCY